MAELLRTVIVTGSNKGVGYGIVENLASKPYKIIMAVRSLERGKQARSNLLEQHPNAQIDVLELDVDKSDSIDQFVSNLSKTYHQVDVLLNNSGIVLRSDTFDGNVVEPIFRTNFYGTIELTEKVIPLLKPQGKVIFVGSQRGKLNLLKSQDLVTRFTNPNLTKIGLFELTQQFYEDVVNNTYEQNGWAKSAYGLSKLSINTYAKVLANDPTVISNQLQVYSCCPGWVRTDMTGDNAPLSIQEGAVNLVYLVELPFEVNKDLQGKFFQDQKVTPL